MGTRQMKNNDVWYDLFVALIKFMNKELYPTNDTGLDVIRIVDFLEEPVDNTNKYTYLNVNTIGYTYVKDDLSIYDENKTLIQTLVQGDTFTMEGITYFLPSNLKVVEKGIQWNNTRIGDIGVHVEMGMFSLEKMDEMKTWTLPQIQISMVSEANIDGAEREGNTSSELKELIFDFGIIVKELDLYENITGYDETYRIKKLVSEIIYDFFNSKQCSHEIPQLSTMKWTKDFEILGEARPVVVSVVGNKLNWR